MLKHCTIICRCLNTENCKAYKYKETGHGNCILIYQNTTIGEGDIFEMDDINFVYLKSNFQYIKISVKSHTLINGVVTKSQYWGRWKENMYIVVPFVTYYYLGFIPVTNELHQVSDWGKSHLISGGDSGLSWILVRALGQCIMRSCRVQCWVGRWNTDGEPIDSSTFTANVE